MKRVFMFFVFMFLFLLSTNSVFAQSKLEVVGKIYSKTEADKLYGRVLESKTLDTDIILKAIERVDYYMMFNIINGKIAIADKNRNQISTEKFELKSDDVMHIYSKTKVAEVLIRGGKSTTTVEKRTDVLTITNGMYTLEMSTPCPPFCK